MRRRGYTYVELIIVISIIGTLVAMLLPAVQACREAARRSTCSRRLSQLLAAVQNYEMHHLVYPPGTVNAQGPILSTPQGYHHNWIVQILPYLELKNASNNVDSSVGVYDPRHRRLRSFQPAILLCPSYARKPDGYSDYAGVHHDLETPIDTDNNGVFFLNSRIRYEDVWDGSSQTLFIGEKWTMNGDLGWMSGTRATLRNAGNLINIGGGGPVWTRVSGRASLEPTSSPADAAPIGDQLSNEQFVDILVGTRDVLGQVVGKTRKPIRRPKIAALAVGSFASMHPGGVMFAFGDGRVDYVSTTTDPVVLSNLANRADGNLDATKN